MLNYESDSQHEGYMKILDNTFKSNVSDQKTKT